MRLIYTVCRAMLDIAVRDGLVRRNVAAAVRRPTIKRAEARYLTVEEVGRLLQAAHGDRLEPLIVLMLGTGLRRGEALALHWSDVDLAAGHGRVRWTLSRAAMSSCSTSRKLNARGGSCHSPPLLPTR